MQLLLLPHGGQLTFVWYTHVTTDQQPAVGNCMVCSKLTHRAQLSKASQRLH